MRLFIDTAEIDEIRDALRLGLVDGVTTNPTLIAKAGREQEEAIKEIASLVEGPISVECLSLDAASMVEEGRRFAEWAPNVVVKVPCTPDGLIACKTLAAEEIDVNVTLVFSPLQALLAARAGARFCSPFVGRLDDVSEKGMDLIRDIAQIYDNYGFETEILVASCRHPIHVLEAALIGADVCTCPYAVLKALVKHPLTDVGVERFLADWRSKWGGSASSPSPPEAKKA